MKKTTNVCLSLALLFCAISSRAQVQSGTIKYEEVVKLNFQLDEQNAQFQNMIPKEQKNTKLLYFTPDATMFVTEPVKISQQRPATPDDAPGGIMVVKMATSGNGEKLFANIKDGTTIEQRDFMMRKFLVTGTVHKAAWKMTGKQKTILTYPCQEATCITEKDTITAWFTSSILVASGPGGWGGLPGMILEASLNSNITFTATSIDAGDVDAKLMTPPHDGKKVTAEEYKTIVAEKMKEMGGTQNGQGTMIIRVNN